MTNQQQGIGQHMQFSLHVHIWSSAWCSTMISCYDFTLKYSKQDDQNNDTVITSDILTRVTGSAKCACMENLPGLVSVSLRSNR